MGAGCRDGDSRWTGKLRRVGDVYTCVHVCTRHTRRTGEVDALLANLRLVARRQHVEVAAQRARLDDLVVARAVHRRTHKNVPLHCVVLYPRVLRRVRHAAAHLHGAHLCGHLV